jgi:hypothetical protein
MDEIESSHILCILLQNPNGVQPSHKDLDFQYGLTKCSEHRVGVISIVETKLNWTRSVKYNVTKWLRQTWKSSVNQSSQIDEGFSSYHQPGGTLTTVVVQWTSRVQHIGQDPFGLGHWSYISLRGQGKTYYLYFGI